MINYKVNIYTDYTQRRRKQGVQIPYTIISISTQSQAKYFIFLKKESLVQHTLLLTNNVQYSLLTVVFLLSTQHEHCDCLREEHLFCFCLQLNKVQVLSSVLDLCNDNITSYIVPILCML